MIERLKTTWTAFGGLSAEEQQFLKEHPSDIVTFNGQPWVDPKFMGGHVYRLSPDFEEPKKRWVEYPIVANDWAYVCDVKHISEFDGDYTECDLYQLQAIVGFGGVQFDGQKDDEWSMDVALFIDKDGDTCAYDTGEYHNKPATPIKARFWVENKETA